VWLYSFKDSIVKSLNIINYYNFAFRFINTKHTIIDLYSFIIEHVINKFMIRDYIEFIINNYIQPVIDNYIKPVIVNYIIPSIVYGGIIKIAINFYENIINGIINFNESNFNDYDYMGLALNEPGFFNNKNGDNLAMDNNKGKSLATDKPSSSSNVSSGVSASSLENKAILERLDIEVKDLKEELEYLTSRREEYSDKWKYRNLHRDYLDLQIEIVKGQIERINIMTVNLKMSHNYINSPVPTNSLAKDSSFHVLTSLWKSPYKLEELFLKEKKILREDYDPGITRLIKTRHQISDHKNLPANIEARTLRPKHIQHLLIPAKLKIEIDPVTKEIKGGNGVDPAILREARYAEAEKKKYRILQI